MKTAERSLKQYIVRLFICLWVCVCGECWINVGNVVYVAVYVWDAHGKLFTCAAWEYDVTCQKDYPYGTIKTLYLCVLWLWYISYTANTNPCIHLHCSVTQNLRGCHLLLLLTLFTEQLLCCCLLLHCVSHLNFTSRVGMMELFKWIINNYIN